MREFDPDLVLGVGGGSALDMAKLLCGFRDVAGDVFDRIRSGLETPIRREWLLLVPTTSGSGSEATHFAVVYISNDKYSVGGEGMRPDVIALDPMLAMSGSRYQRATSAIDAVAHAIESRWAVSATDRSRRFARAALRVLLSAIERFVNDPNLAAARAMCIGSHYAGRAIDISRTTAAHALSYGITKSYGISHGHAVALTLGAFIEAHAVAAPEQLSPGLDPHRHAETMAEIIQALGGHDGPSARSRFRKLLERLGLDPSLTNGGAGAHAAQADLAASVNAERLGNNPVRLSTAQLTNLISGVNASTDSQS
jgi:alcohol dehydrogenase class IV